MIVIVETLLTLKFSARFRLVKSSNLRFQFSSDALTRSLSEVEVEWLGLVVGVSDIVVAFNKNSLGFISVERRGSPKRLLAWTRIRPLSWSTWNSRSGILLQLSRPEEVIEGRLRARSR